MWNAAIASFTKTGSSTVFNKREQKLMGSIFHTPPQTKRKEYIMQLPNEIKTDEIKSEIYTKISNAIIEYYEEGKEFSKFLKEIETINKTLEMEHDRHWQHIYKEEKKKKGQNKK